MSIKINIPTGVTALAVHGLRQWDYGQTLEIHDDTLPAEIEVHFAHVGLREAVVVECSVENGVATAEIPDVLLEQDKPLTAWIYEKDGESGETTKTVTLYIEARAKPLATDEARLLHVLVMDKIAVYRNRDGDIVCGNGDYRMQFTFGEAWAGVTDKVARFVWNGQYFDKPIDENGIAEVPVIMNTNQVLVGVYSETMQTTTSAAIGCRPSILCKTDVPQPAHGQSYSEQAKQAAADAITAAASAAESEAKAAESATKVAESAAVVAAKEGLTANALKGSASGEIVTLNDVSPVAHEMRVGVRGKNLLNPDDYAGALYQTTLEGDVFTTTFEVNSLYLNAKKTVTHKAGTYTVTLVPVSSGMYCNIYIYSAAELSKLITSKTIQNKSEPVSLTFTANDGFALCISGRECSEDNGKVGAGVFSYKLMLEEGTSATAYAPYIDDVSSVNVLAHGKNLLDIHNRTKGKATNGANTMQRTLETDKYYIGLTMNNYCYDYNVTLSEYADGVWRIENKAAGYGVAFPVAVKPNTNYYLSGVNDFVRVGFYDKDGNYIKYANGNTFFTTPSNCAIATICLVPLEMNTAAEFSTCQLELGTTATEYEPYIDPVTHDVSADGSVEGVAARYPSTTLMTSQAGAVLDVTYNRDINKAFLELQKMIIEMGV